MLSSREGATREEIIDEIIDYLEARHYSGCSVAKEMAVINEVWVRCYPGGLAKVAGSE